MQLGTTCYRNLNIHCSFVMTYLRVDRKICIFQRLLFQYAQLHDVPQLSNQSTVVYFSMDNYNKQCSNHMSDKSDNLMLNDQILAQFLQLPEDCDLLNLNEKSVFIPLPCCWLEATERCRRSD